MLEKVFGSKTKVIILRELSSHPNMQFTVRDLSRTLNIPYGSAHPAVMSLIRSRLVKARKVGRTNIINYNVSHLLSDQVRVLFEQEKSVHLSIARKFVKELDKKGVKNVLLFGSTVRKGAFEPGDIDLLIILKKASSKRNDSKLIDRFLMDHDTIISPLYLSGSEMRERIKMYDGFILRVVDEGLMLYGEEEWLKAS